MVNVDQLSICTHKTIYDALIELSIRWLPQADAEFKTNG